MWNSISVLDEDYSIAPITFTFGPCNPCSSCQLSLLTNLVIRDDDDLEFSHGIDVSASLTSHNSLAPSNTLSFNFEDDGRFAICVNVLTN